MNSPDESKHWDKTSRLMIVMMSIWFFFGFLIHVFVNQLNSIKLFGFPFGYYMAAQGSLIVFVAMLFWFAKAQDRIDRESGFAEDE